MNNIYEEISKKKLNEKLVKSLTPEEQSFWLEWLNEGDKHENSYARQCRRKEISLNSKINNGRTNNETTPLDLFIDDSPNPLDFLIQKEDEEFTLAQLPRLKKVLSELDELDRDIILLCHSFEEYEYTYRGETYINYKKLSFREMGRRLNEDYRKIQRKIPKIMSYIKERYGLNSSDFPESNKKYLQSLSLPFYPSMSEDDSDYVIEKVIKLAKLNRR